MIDLVIFGAGVGDSIFLKYPLTQGDRDIAYHFFLRDRASLAQRNLTRRTGVKLRFGTISSSNPAPASAKVGPELRIPKVPVQLPGRQFNRR